MDEEGKKINLSNFFERSDSIDKKASAALSKSNSAISAISANKLLICLLYTSPSPRDGNVSRMPSSA